MHKSFLCRFILGVGLFIAILAMCRQSVMAASLSWEPCRLPSENIPIIKDIAISSEGRLFIITGDVDDNLWSTSDNGANWEKIYSSTHLSAGRLQKVFLSPLFSQNHTLYLLGIENGSSVICKSLDGGGSFQVLNCLDPATGSRITIDAWCLAQDDTLLAAAFDGDQSWFFSLPPGAATFDQKILLGRQVINSLALSPNYISDKTLAAGGIDGGVYLSQDSQHFQSVPTDLLTSPLHGNVSLVFDIGYTGNKTLYACGDQSGNGIFRLTVGNSQNWESLSSNLPVGAVYRGIVNPSGGVLYCLDMQPVDSTNHKGGLLRFLNPTSGTYEVITSGIPEGSQMHQLWMGNSILWSYDSTLMHLMCLRLNALDNITLNTPLNLATGLDPANIILTWEPASGVVLYEWQIDTDTDFASIPAAHKGQTGSVSVKLPALESGTIYYWRVRAVNQPGSSWSTIRSFSTRTTSAKVILATPPNLASALDPANITLSWKSLSGVTGYEWQIDSDPDFTSKVVAYQGQTKATNIRLPVLENDTIYYWRVRAGSSSDNPWSEIRSFSTFLSSQLHGPQLLSPSSDKPVVIQPILKWSPLPGALNYELNIARDDAFSEVVIDKSGASACNATVWLCDRQLEYKTAYYWKVRAINSTNTSDWSVVSLFVTEDLPAVASSTSIISTPQSAIQPTATVVVTAVVAAPTVTVIAPPVTIESQGFSSKMFVPLLACVIVLTLTVVVLVITVVRKT